MELSIKECMDIAKEIGKYTQLIAIIVTSLVVLSTLFLVLVLKSHAHILLVAIIEGIFILLSLFIALMIIFIKVRNKVNK